MVKVGFFEKGHGCKKSKNFCVKRSLVFANSNEPVQSLGGWGDSHIKRTGLLVVLFGIKKKIWYLLGCSA